MPDEFAIVLNFLLFLTMPLFSNQNMDKCISEAIHNFVLSVSGQ
jgi:hypothetical protein